MSFAGSGRVPLIAGNWKMHKTGSEGAAFIRNLAERVEPLAGREVVVAPAFTGLYEASLAARGTCIGIAAQDVFWEPEGAFTGEVSPRMLADLGVGTVIVGHSERRRLFGESDEDVGRKVRALLDGGLSPLLCVGESQDQREAGSTESVLSAQVEAGLSLVYPDETGFISVAYEPVWAIGTGRAATPEVAQTAAAFIRGLIHRSIGPDAARVARILYGGSVGPENIDEFMAQPDVDGVLAGGASLDLESFGRLVRFEAA